MIKICTSLTNSGYDVHIIGFKSKKSTLLTKQPYKQERLALLFQRGKLFYLEICIRLFFKLLFKRVNIISSVDMDTLLPAYLVAKLRNKTLVFDAHEYYSETSGLVGRKLEKGLWAKLEFFLIPKVKKAYTVNQSLADIFHKQYGVKFNVILNTPVLEDIPDFEDHSEHFYLYQGILNKGRGLEELIEVFSKKNLKLKIAGDGPLKEQLQKEIELIGIADRVKLLGFVPPRELKRLTAQSYAGLNLIEGKGKSYYFSLANKFFDYIHAEIPQIGMNFPEYKRVNDRYNTSFLIDSFSEIGAAVEKMEDDKKYYYLLKTNTREAKKEFNWSKEEKKLIDIYRSLS